MQQIQYRDFSQHLVGRYKPTHRTLSRFKGCSVIRLNESSIIPSLLLETSLAIIAIIELPFLNCYLLLNKNYWL